MALAVAAIVREKAELLQRIIAQALSLVDDACDTLFRSQLGEKPLAFFYQIQLCRSGLPLP
jgi:hypothetical protein